MKSKRKESRAATKGRARVASTHIHKSHTGTFHAIVSGFNSFGLRKPAQAFCSYAILGSSLKSARLHAVRVAISG